MVAFSREKQDPGQIHSADADHWIVIFSLDGRPPFVPVGKIIEKTCYPMLWVCKPTAADPRLVGFAQLLSEAGGHAVVGRIGREIPILWYCQKIKTLYENVCDIHMPDNMMPMLDCLIYEPDGGVIQEPLRDLYRQKSVRQNMKFDGDPDLTSLAKLI